MFLPPGRRPCILLALLLTPLLLLGLSSQLHTRPRAYAFDPHAFPAYVVNGATAYAQRKWIEVELSRIGYTSYVRLNGRRFTGLRDDCIRTGNGTAGANACRQGLTHAHYLAWLRVAADASHEAALVLEDDAFFHSNFTQLFPVYYAMLPPDWALVYVGQLSRLESPSPTLLQSSVMPWCTHAYLIRRRTAVLLASHYAYLLSRAGSPHAPLPFYEPAIPQSHPFMLSVWEMNADFFLLSVHRYFAAPGTWFAFESTPRVPASAALMDGGLHNWTDGRAIEAQFLVEEQCEGLKSNQSRSEWHTNDSAVEAHCRHGAAICTSACARQWGRSVGKFPVTGTGLAYQNGCASVGVPFALRWWLGEGEAALAPSCAELRARIRPSPDSEAAPEDCSDAA